MRRTLTTLTTAVATAAASLALAGPLASPAAAGDDWFSNIKQKDATFYPHVRDGYKDTTRVTFDHEQDSDATAIYDITDAGGDPVVDDSNDAAFYSNGGAITWNGRDDDGNKVAGGTYTITLTATDWQGFTHTLSRTVRVTSGTKWFTEDVKVKGSAFDAKHEGSSCSIYRARSYGETWMDCVGGTAWVKFRGRLDYDLRLRGLDWAVRGERGCCDGRVIKTFTRSKAHPKRFTITVKITNWAAYEVHRVAWDYRAKRRV